MKYALLLVLGVSLSACSPVRCVDGKLYMNPNPLGFGNIYAETGRECKVI